MEELRLKNVRYGSLEDERGEPIFGTACSCCVENNMKVAEYLHDKGMTLLGNHTAAMTRVFGKNPTSFRSEFLYRIWPFEFRGRIFFVLTGRRGTSIEINVASVEKYSKSEAQGEIAIKFIKALQDALVPV